MRSIASRISLILTLLLVVTKSVGQTDPEDPSIPVGFPENPVYGYFNTEIKDDLGNATYRIVRINANAGAGHRELAVISALGPPQLCDTNVAWYLHRTKDSGRLICVYLRDPVLFDTIFTARETLPDELLDSLGVFREQGYVRDGPLEISTSRHGSFYANPLRPLSFRLRDSLTICRMPNYKYDFFEIRHLMSRGNSRNLWWALTTTPPAFTCDFTGIIVVRKNNQGMTSQLPQLSSISMNSLVGDTLAVKWRQDLPSYVRNALAYSPTSPLFLRVGRDDPDPDINLFRLDGDSLTQITFVDAPFVVSGYTVYADSVVYYVAYDHRRNKPLARHTIRCDTR